MAHCPVPPLGTAQVPVSQVGSDTVTIFDATGGAGHRRGIFVFLHPSLATNLQNPPPIPAAWDGFNALTLLKNNLTADGWVFVYPAYLYDWSVGNAKLTITNQENDCANDTGHGSRQATSVALWWDHMVAYLAKTYGAGRPTILGGFSLGAWTTVEIILQRPNSCVGFFAHCLPTVWSNLNSVGLSFPANTTGMDLGTTALNFTSVKGIVGYNKTDGTVGWGLSTDPGYLGPPESNANAILTNAAGAGAPITAYRSVSQAPFSQTATAASSPGGGPYTLTFSSTTNFLINQTVTGAGITGSATVSQIVTSTGVITLTGTIATGGLTASSYTFTDPVHDESNAYPNGHLFLTTDAYRYATPPPTTNGWVNTVIDPLVPPNTF